MSELSSQAVAALRQAQTRILEVALDRISAGQDWYAELSQTARDQIASVAGMGVDSFVLSIESPADAPEPGRIFAVAPPELTGEISLHQTLAMVRTVLDVVIDEAPSAVPEADQDALRIRALTFGRDVGFAAAEVYAQAAEAHGAWDARLESVAVDALLHEPGAIAVERAASAGWGSSHAVLPIASQGHVDAMAISKIRHVLTQRADDALISVRGDSVIIILGIHEGPDAERTARALAREVAARVEGPSVIGNLVPGIVHAGPSLRSALEGLRARRAWAECPNPVQSDELLAERLLLGDELAAARLAQLVAEPLAAMGEGFVETVEAYLASGRSLEHTAKELFIHANTVRYRLGRIAEVTGWDPADPRDGLVLQLALMRRRLDLGAAA